MADNQKLFFIEDNGAPVSPPEFWPALVITSEEIEEEITRLSAKRIAAGESRRAYVVHPNSVEQAVDWRPVSMSQSTSSCRARRLARSARARVRSRFAFGVAASAALAQRNLHSSRETSGTSRP